MMMKSLVMFFSVLLSVGFYTMVERKVLGYMQLRKGVNKAALLGLPQPLVDAVKLFIKENPSINKTNKFIYILSPLFALFVVFVLWFLYVSSFGFSFFSLGVLFFLCVSSLNVYAILLAGWSSNSKYALLGSLRAIAQTISYEVSMALVLFLVIGFSLSFDFYSIGSYQFPVFYMIYLFPVFVMWIISSLAETNRAPFDFAEGESELVSGFNVEYGSSVFAFLFIAEYGSILLICMLTEVLFLFGFMVNMGMMVFFFITFFFFFFLWVRASYPRMRYDKLMSLTWKSFLSIVLGFIVLISPFFYVTAIAVT